MKKIEREKIIKKINKYCEKHGMKNNLSFLLRNKTLTYYDINELTKDLIKMKKDKQFVQIVLDKKGAYCGAKIVPMSKFQKCKANFTFIKWK